MQKRLILRICLIFAQTIHFTPCYSSCYWYYFIKQAKENLTLFKITWQSSQCKHNKLSWNLKKGLWTGTKISTWCFLTWRHFMRTCSLSNCVYPFFLFLMILFIYCFFKKRFLTIFFHVSLTFLEIISNVLRKSY